MLRFKTKGKIFDVAITAVAGMLSVCVMIYAICHFGLKESWPELVLNLFYVTCLTMMWMYFFNKLKPAQFNYWCSVLVGVTVLLRDILFAPTLVFYSLHLRHLYGASRRIHSLSFNGDMDSSYHHLRNGGLFCFGTDNAKERKCQALN